MKKILYTCLGLGVLVATSCSMDLEPVGTILASEAIETVDDCAAFRNGFYNNVRALSTGGYISYTEIQMDNFIGTITNGNRLGSINNGRILSNDSDFQGIWGGLWGAIAGVNFYMERAEPLIKSAQEEYDALVDLKESETGKKVEEKDIPDVDREKYSAIQQMKRYFAEAHFMRAYFYYWLMDHFCPAINDPNLRDFDGLPIVTAYNPTADKSTYPGRKSLPETYKFIEDNLDIALEGLLAYEKYVDTAGTPEEKQELSSQVICPMAAYICSWTVKAMQARLALGKGDFQTAYNLAVDVINNGNYTLATRADYAAMWTNDMNNEIIFRPVSSKDELGISSTGSAWISTSEFQADYMPVPRVAIPGDNSENFLYVSRDVRYTSFIGERRLLSNGSFVKIPVFIKYPGNPALIQSNPNLMNMPKPFRLSEQYLIAAEAACELNMVTEANNYLQDIRVNRISRYDRPTTNFTGTQLRDEIRLERLRELIGEGFRMSDLRRWGLGFTRDALYNLVNPALENVLVKLGTAVRYEANDYRYVWPIPSDEIENNPQLVGQQNPGY